MRRNNGHRLTRRAFIIGGGVMGLTASLELARVSRRYGVPYETHVFESSAFGGGRSVETSSRRCQLWCHAEGVIYAQSQPAVALALQKSTSALRHIAPDAFAQPFAVAVEPTIASTPADVAFAALGIEHREVSSTLLKQWFGIDVPVGSRSFRTRDQVMNLRLLSRRLANHARRRGVRLIRNRIDAIRIESERCVSLRFGNEEMRISDGDIVVLCCGSRIRTLLRNEGITIPGLRVFQCHLVATEQYCIRALVAVLGGGVNCVPHELASGKCLNIFGDARRTEIPVEHSGPPEPDTQLIAELCSDVQETLGLRLPSKRVSWPAVKTEIVTKGIRSQLHHAFRVSELDNVWLAIPGKLSQSAECARDLSLKVIASSLDDEIARPIWEDSMYERTTASPSPVVVGD